MRICIISMDVDDELYGSTKSCQTIITYLDEKCTGELSYFSLNKKGLLYKNAYNLGIPVGYFNSKWKYKTNKTIKVFAFFTEKLRCLIRLILFIINNKSELIYINTSVSSLPALCGFLCRKNVILHMRESGENLIKKGKLRLLNKDVFSFRRFIFRKCVGKFLAVSKHTKNFLLTTLGDVDVEVLYNHIEYDHYNKYKANFKTITKELKINSDQKIVACITRIDRLKGIDDLIRIATVCDELIPEVCFLIIGGPINSAFFINEIEPQFKALKNIKHLPFKNDIRNYFAIADVVLNPSKAEAFGRTNIEAMAMSKCVIAREIDAVPEIIEDGHNGFLFPEDDIDNVPLLIKNLLSNHNLREKIGKNATLTVAEKFSSSASIKNLYKALNLN